jgi:hypothetical protein
MDIKELPLILADFKLALDQYDLIAAHPFYAAALDEARREWNSAMSTSDRIKVEAAATLEQALPFLGAKMIKKDESLDAQVKAGQLLAKLAGVGEGNGNAGAPGDKFTINIDLGGDRKIEFTRDVTPALPAATFGQPAALSQNPEGKS